MSEAKKSLRKRNRTKYFDLHCKLTRKADECGEKGYFDACFEYRKEAQAAYKKYEFNGGR